MDGLRPKYTLVLLIASLFVTLAGTALAIIVGMDASVGANLGADFAAVGATAGAVAAVVVIAGRRGRTMANGTRLVDVALVLTVVGAACLAIVRP